MVRDWLLRARALFGRKAMDADLDSELRDHLDHQIAWHKARGLSADDARRQAVMDIGGVEVLKEQLRDERRGHWLEDIRRDIVYAFRLLQRSPGFAAVAILSLALGLGANTIAFSVAHALVLRPLPVRAPGEVAFVESSPSRPTMSFPNYRDFRDRTTTLAGLAAYRFSTMGLSRGATSERVWGYLVTGNYFDLLGVKPARGRLFTPADDGAPGSNRVAILSYATWRDRFSSDASIVGRSILVNAGAYTVVGVLPPEFRGTERFFTPDIWLPMSMEPDIETFSWLDSRAAFNACVVGRLKPGVTSAQASVDLNAIAADLAREYPDDNAGMAITLTTPGWLGDSLGAPVGGFTRGIVALAALVLLAACVNLAGLLLARATDRRREFAIRLAVGAGRLRIARQLIVEALVLAAAGGAAGIALASFLLRALSHWRAPLQLPVELDVTPDWHVMVLAAIVTVATGLLFGSVPARNVWRVDLTSAWKGAPSTRAGRRHWSAREWLVVLQIALCSVLVLASFVAVRGLYSAVDAPVGFEPQDVTVAGFDLRLARYDGARGQVFQRQILDDVQALPGVTSVAFADTLPLNIDQSHMTVFPERPPASGPDAGIDASAFLISPNFFHTMRTRVLAGRDFAWTDTDRAPAVAIVNQTFARDVLGLANPIGARFRYGRGGAPVEVIGLVEDGKYVSLVESPQPAVFRPAPAIYNGSTLMVARTAPGRGAVVNDIVRLVGRADPNVPIYAAGTEMDMLALALFPARAAIVALGAFGTLALMLALTGTYGLAAYAVSGRTREIGIRMAIGARPAQVVWEMLGRIAWLMAAGTAGGLVLGVLGRSILGAVVYQATSADPFLLAGALAAMAAVGFVAAWVPARRALRVDPVKTLRAE